MNRYDRQDALETELVQFAPRNDGEAEEILDAWMAGVESGNDHDLTDIEYHYKKLREALIEAAGNVYVYEPDECTLAKWKAEEKL